MRMSMELQNIAGRLSNWTVPLVVTGILVGLIAYDGNEVSPGSGGLPMGQEVNQENYQPHRAFNKSTGVLNNPQEVPGVQDTYQAPSGLNESNRVLRNPQEMPRIQESYQPPSGLNETIGPLPSPPSFVSETEPRNILPH